MSKTPHSEHIDQGEPNCIACRLENNVELEVKELKECIEAPFVAYSAYHEGYANDWDSLSNALNEVQHRGYGAVYVKVDCLPDLREQMRLFKGLT